MADGERAGVYFSILRDSRAVARCPSTTVCRAPPLRPLELRIVYQRYLYFLEILFKRLRRDIEDGGRRKRERRRAGSAVVQIRSSGSTAGSGSELAYHDGGGRSTEKHSLARPPPASRRSRSLSSTLSANISTACKIGIPGALSQVFLNICEPGNEPRVTSKC